MRRRVKKTMAFLLAFALVFSMVKTDRLWVSAETAESTESAERMEAPQETEREEASVQSEGESPIRGGELLDVYDYVEGRKAHIF